MSRKRNRPLGRLGLSASVGGSPRETLSSSSEAFIPVMEARPLQAAPPPCPCWAGGPVPAGSRERMRSRYWVRSGCGGNPAWCSVSP